MIQMYRFIRLAVLTIGTTCLALFLNSCADDDGPLLPNTSNVIVVNEGNFFSANGSLSNFDKETNQVDISIYEANATIQNAIRAGDRLYLVTNAPDRLDIFDVDETEIDISASITSGFSNPIGFARVGDFGYVTNWGPFTPDFELPDPYLAIIDLNTNQLVDSLELAVRPQEIIAVDSRLYIANEGGATVSVYEAEGTNTAFITNINVPVGPSTFVQDAQGDLWVLCTSGNLVELNLNNNSVSRTLEGLTVNGFDEKMAINSTGTILYFLGGTNDSFTGLTAVFRVNLTGTSLQVEPFVTGGFAFYGIGVDPENGDVYVADNNAFSSTGTAFVYDTDGTELRTFATGIGPNSFVFL